MLRRAIRKVLRIGGQWLEGQPSYGPLDSWALPFTLNPTYVRVRQQPGCDHAYTWGVVHGVHLAKVLGVDRVSAVEFGVAGGKSLLALEDIADTVRAAFGITVDVYGFDTGTGMPKPVDYRDMPNLWSEGFFKMGVDELRSRLRHARLIIGEIGSTLGEFVNSGPAPVCFVSFDVDYYSSTRDALRLFDAMELSLLPRVYCYFDDILGYTFGDCVGERLAIADFNAEHNSRKISQIYGLRHYVPKRFSNELIWDKQYMAHIFDHSLYNQFDGSTDRRCCTLTE